MPGHVMSTGPWSRPAAPVRRAAITNLGCKVNQSEVDGVERLLRARGVEIVTDGVAVEPAAHLRTNDANAPRRAPVVLLPA